MVGRVLTFDRRTGYGFIRADNAGPDDQDVFLHVSVLPASLKEVLKKDDRVEFEVVPGDQGVKAVRVRLVAPGQQLEVLPDAPEPDKLSPVEFGMAIAPALSLVTDRSTRSRLSERLLAVAREHGWVE
jgi:cold shock CspA family protein